MKLLLLSLVMITGFFYLEGISLSGPCPPFIRFGSFCCPPPGPACENGSPAVQGDVCSRTREFQFSCGPQPYLGQPLAYGSAYGIAPTRQHILPPEVMAKLQPTPPRIAGLPTTPFILHPSTELFHGTHTRNLKSIQAQGLDPHYGGRGSTPEHLTGKSDSKIHFAFNLATAQAYASDVGSGRAGHKTFEQLILRYRVPEGRSPPWMYDPHQHTGDAVTTTETIPATSLEVYDGRFGIWVPLVGWIPPTEAELLIPTPKAAPRSDCDSIRSPGPSDEASRLGGRVAEVSDALQVAYDASKMDDDAEARLARRYGPRVDRPLPPPPPPAPVRDSASGAPPPPPRITKRGSAGEAPPPPPVARGSFYSPPAEGLPAERSFAHGVYEQLYKSPQELIPLPPPPTPTPPPRSRRSRIP